MDNPLIPFVVPAVLGGGVLALVLFLTGRPSQDISPASIPGPGISTDIINAAHIPVAGVGGLGLVAMATIVAWYLPAIRVSMAIAGVSGVLLAAALIAWRRVH
jgi:hypothetical protein